jgi:N4-gp56 family major capsid protein
MAGSTTSTLDDLLPSIIQEAMFVAQEQSIMRGLVRNYSLAPGQGKVVNVPIYPKQTAAALTEGEEVSNTAVSTSTASMTVATNAIRTMVTDLARTASASNVVADIGRLFGEAIAAKMDKDLLALFSGFSVGAGDATTTLSAATIATAVAKLRAVGVPSNDLAIVLNPYVAYDLKSNLTNAFANPGAGMIQNDAMKQGFLGMLFGCPVYETANLVDTGTAGDYVGAVFHRDALGLATIGDITIETQRRASYLGDDIIASCHYAVGELYDGYGVKITADSTLL